MNRTLLLAANLALECLLLIREASSSHSTCSCSASGAAGCLLQFCLILDVESIVTSQPFRLWRSFRQSLIQAGIDHKLTDAPSCLIPKSEAMHWLRCANRRPSPLPSPINHWKHSAEPCWFLLPLARRCPTRHIPCRMQLQASHVPTGYLQTPTAPNPWRVDCVSCNKSSQNSMHTYLCVFACLYQESNTRKVRG